MGAIGILGAFGFSSLEETTGGQPVKTRGLYYGLCDIFGKNMIKYVETYQWKKHPFRMIFQLMGVIWKCSTIIMLPAQNGISVFIFILQILKRKDTKLYYDVIGGWIAEKAEKDENLINRLKKLDGIWVETSSMKRDLNKLGINNVEVIPNFKRIKPIALSELKGSPVKPYKVCTFSRVMREKGVSDAIIAVRKLNLIAGEKLLELDIYGPIDDSYKHEFCEMIDKKDNSVKYMGVADPGNSVNVIKSYDALLFPTKFYTEGIPGTIIDAYSAGVPIITSLWLNSEDVFWEGETGWGYHFDEQDGLFNLLIRFSKNASEFAAMKENCLKRSKLFTSDTLMKKIKQIILNG